MKEEFEYNRWYLDTRNPKAIFYTTEDKCYGVNACGEWVSVATNRISPYIKWGAPATEKEVKERLLAYAKEKYPVGTKYRDVNEPECACVKGELGCFKTLGGHIYITDGNDGSVYFDGKWAEVIPEESSSKVNSLRSLDVEEFKVGDWVVITNYSGSTHKMGDVDKIACKKENKIQTDLMHKKYPDFEGWLTPKNVRKATPEEIQQYLPEGHPDRIDSKNYDLSTTITRAVKNNDPSIIVRESGKSVEELCSKVDELDGNCLRKFITNNTDIWVGCDGLMCKSCPLSLFLAGHSPSEIKQWLRGEKKDKCFSNELYDNNLELSIRNQHIKSKFELTNDNSNSFDNSKKEVIFVSLEEDDVIEYKALPVQSCSSVEFVSEEE